MLTGRERLNSSGKMGGRYRGAVPDMIIIVVK